MTGNNNIREDNGKSKDLAIGFNSPTIFCNDTLRYKSVSLEPSTLKANPLVDDGSPWNAVRNIELRLSVVTTLISIFTLRLSKLKFSFPEIWKRFLF